MEVMNNMQNGIANGVGVAINSVGWSFMHAVSPDNFSYYCCSLELLENGKTLGFLSFPVMPNQMSESKTESVNIVKTLGGVVSNFNASFIPRDINLQGTFGRKLRVIVGAKEAKKSESPWAMNVNFGLKIKDTEVMIKTGYGLIKLLKNMIDAAYERGDNGRPRTLIFRNYAFNTAYVVEVTQYSFSQGVENNTLWFYSLNMRAVADASAVSKQNFKTYILRTNVPNLGKAVEKFARSATQFDLSKFWG